MLPCQVKILKVVDDSVSDRLNIRNTLSEYHILTGPATVREAMRVLEEHNGISILILDLEYAQHGWVSGVLEALKKMSVFGKLCTYNIDKLWRTGK